jgi:dolichol-phosphate mannosyltransferase
MKIISICIPIFNEKENINIFYNELNNILKEKKNYNFEIIFTDNNSTDSSEQIIEELIKKDNRIKYIKFSENYGYEKSLELGYLYSSGEAIISIDCDLQDPPSLILDMIKYWEDGYELITTERKEEYENSFSLNLKKFFYNKILKKGKKTSLSGDFRLVSSKVKPYLSKNINKTIFLRSFISDLDFKRKNLEYKRNSRIRGASKSNLLSYFKIIRKALVYENNSIFNGIIYINLIAFIFSIGLTFFYLIIKIFKFQALPQGLASIHILSLLNIGLSGISFIVIFMYLKRLVLNTINTYPKIIKKININTKSLE